MREAVIPTRTDKQRFNDGVVQVYREADRKTDFGAKRNVRLFDNMHFIAKLDFAEQSRRQQDMEFAEQMGFSLSLKIKTRYLRDVDNKCKCVIGDMLYDISYIDTTRTEMYFYLQEVRRLVETDRNCPESG